MYGETFHPNRDFRKEIFQNTVESTVGQENLHSTTTLSEFRIESAQRDCQLQTGGGWNGSRNELTKQSGHPAELVMARTEHMLLWLSGTAPLGSVAD